MQQHQQQHHTEPPYGAEIWARLMLSPAAAANADEDVNEEEREQQHWRQLLEGLGALYHFPLGLAASSTADHGTTDGIAAASVIGGGGGGRVRPSSPWRASASFCRLSLPLAAKGGYRLRRVPPPAPAPRAAATTAAPTARLRYAHLPAPAGLCTDALHRTLLRAGPSLLSPCRGAGGGLGALLARGVWGGGEGSPPLLTADYLGYALELRRMCLDDRDGEGAEEANGQQEDRRRTRRR